MASASRAHSQWRPWKRAKRRSSDGARSGTSSNSGRASPAAPANSCSRTVGPSGSMLGASSCITTPKANSVSMMLPRARSTTMPRPSASAAASSISVVLPIPAAPSITMSPPAPAAAASSPRPICAVSASRSSNSVRVVRCAIRHRSAYPQRSAAGEKNLRWLHVAKAGGAAVASRHERTLRSPRHTRARCRQGRARLRARGRA